MISQTQIRSAILASSSLRQLCESGNDATLAGQIAITTPSGYRLNRTGVLNILGPIEGAKAIYRLRTLAAEDSALKQQSETNWIVLREILETLLDPEGLDISHPDAATMLTMMVTLAIVTSEQAAAIGAKGVSVEHPTTDQVTAAVAVWRPDGRSCPIPNDATP